MSAHFRCKNSRGERDTSRRWFSSSFLSVPFQE